MAGAERQPRGPRPWRPITKYEVALACAAYLMAHSECGEAVRFSREGRSLVCWCELCQVLRTYAVVGGGDYEQPLSPA